jgi:hypothetical protein
MGDRPVYKKVGKQRLTARPDHNQINQGVILDDYFFFCFPFLGSDPKMGLSLFGKVTPIFLAFFHVKKAAILTFLFGGNYLVISEDMRKGKNHFKNFGGSWPPKDQLPL